MKNNLLFFVLFCLSALRVTAAQGYGPGLATAIGEIHQIGLFQAGFIWNPGAEKGDIPFGFEIASYEYISPAGWAAHFAPINSYLWIGTVQKGPFSGPSEFSSYPTVTDQGDREAINYNYAPLWFHYYHRRSAKHAWPFIGVGLNYHHFYADDEPGQSGERRQGWGPAGEIGVALGNDTRSRTLLQVKIFPPSSAAHDSVLYVFSIGHAISVGKR